MAEQKRKWLDEVDIMRAMGIIAVLVIHSTGTAVNLAKQSIAYNSLMALNNFSLFAVPLFLFISAMILAYKYSAEAKINWGKFYSNRLTQIIIPYIIWTVIYLLYSAFYLGTQFKAFATHGYADDAKFIVNTLIFGRGFFHLYFISIIVQFYIIFPLVIILFKWLASAYGKLKLRLSIKSDSLAVSAGEFIVFFVLVLACQYLFIILNKYYIYPHFNSTGVLLPSYIMPIGIGLWLGYNLDNWDKLKNILRAIAVPLFFVSGWLFVNVMLNNWYLGKPDANLIAVIRNIYVTCASIVIYDIAMYIKAKWNSKVTAVISDLGACSFGIYLLHLLILKTMHKVGFLALAGGNMYVYGALILASFIVTLAGSWILVKLINRTFLAPILFGNRKVAKK